MARGIQKMTINEIIEELREYISSDARREELFTGIEIACRRDQFKADETMDDILSSFSKDDIRKFITRQGNDFNMWWSNRRVFRRIQRAKA